MNATDKINAQLSAVFVNIENPSHIDSVIDRALEHRDKANEGTRSRLNAVIRNSIGNLPGFKDSSKAPNHLLRAPMILDMMKGNDRLAGSVLIAWMESHESLKEVVVEHLTGRGIPTGGIDARKGSFDSLWRRSEWENERETLRESHTGLDDDDITLMLCCVSGRLPEPLLSEEQRIESELFRGWIEDLKKLDSDTDDWLDLELFKNAVSQLGESKAVERVKAQSEAIESGLAEIVDEYSDELQYLGVEVGAWPGDGMRYSKSTFTEAGEFVSRLREGLGEYRPIRPQASTREQELERVVVRAEREQAILDASGRWGEFVAGLEDAPNNDPAGSEDGSSGGVSGGASAEGAALMEEREALKVELDGLKLEVERLRVENAESAGANGITAEKFYALERDVGSLIYENEQVKETNRQMRGANEGLESDKRALGEQIRRLRRQLAENRQMADMWRQSYEEERAKQAQSSELNPSELESVREALELAERTFPDQLLLTLNSKSDKNSPFQKPDEVYAALEWLATEYRSLRLNPGGSPDFNMLLKQACAGWSYKPGQTEVTKEQFNEWYTAKRDGKTYELKTHLAKGTSHDPQNTMRIAFAWDDDLSKVVVGYLGLHQRNRRSA